MVNEIYDRPFILAPVVMEVEADIRVEISGKFHNMKNKGDI